MTTREYRIDVVRTRKYLVTARSKAEAEEIVSAYDANSEFGDDRIEDRFVRSKLEDSYRIQIDRQDAFPEEFEREPDEDGD